MAISFICIISACEQVVSRSFPVSTLTREKKINVLYLNHIEHWLQECLQLRSHMFQVIIRVLTGHDVRDDRIIDG